MSATVLYMSMSLDGFIAGPNEGPGNDLGDGGHRLHEWALTGADADHERAGRPGGSSWSAPGSSRGRPVSPTCTTGSGAERFLERRLMPVMHEPLEL